MKRTFTQIKLWDRENVINFGGFDQIFIKCWKWVWAFKVGFEDGMRSGMLTSTAGERGNWLIIQEKLYPF